MSKLVKIAGIAIAASRVKAKATHVTLLCKNCRSVKTVACRPGLGGAIVPRSCDHVPQVYAPTIVLNYRSSFKSFQYKNFDKIVCSQGTNNIHNLSAPKQSYIQQKEHKNILVQTIIYC